MCSFFRVSRNAFLRPESVCKVTALFCLCQKVRQCLTLFNLSAPRLACRRRHSRKASAKVRPFSSTAKFFRTFFRGFFAKTGQNRPSNTQNAIIPQYSTTNIFYENNGSDENNGNNGNNGSDGNNEDNENNGSVMGAGSYSGCFESALSCEARAQLHWLYNTIALAV